MKLPGFRHAAPESLDEAVDLLGAHGPEAAVLAGGQSLLVEMRYRDRTPSVLVDLNGVPGLAAVERRDDAVRVGALVRHADLEAAPARRGAASVPSLPGALGRLVGLVAPLVGHPPVRARGTFVGSLAWAHPSAEWCALAALLDATVVLRGPRGVRHVPADRWFTGRQSTDRRADELVVEAWLPVLLPGTGVGFVEHRRTHGSFALVAALAAVRLGPQGEAVDVRLSLAGAGDVPVRARAAERALAGSAPDAASLRAAAQEARDAADPRDEPHCSTAYRRHAVAVVAERALAAAVDDAARSAP